MPNASHISKSTSDLRKIQHYTLFPNPFSGRVFSPAHAIIKQPILCTNFLRSPGLCEKRAFLVGIFCAAQKETDGQLISCILLHGPAWRSNLIALRRV